jgi:hypothetical protein
VIIFASTVPLSIVNTVSGFPHNALPYSVTDPVTLLEASTLRSAMIAWPPPPPRPPAAGSGAAPPRPRAIAASVPHLPAKPFACPYNEVIANEHTAIIVMILSFILFPLGSR